MPTFSFDPSQIAKNPSYQFRLGDMVRAVDRSNAARGTSFTPAAREELLQRAGGLASDELGNEFNRQLSTFNTNWGVNNDIWNQNRMSTLDAQDWDTNLFNRGRVSQLDAWTRDDALWNRGRTSELDARDWDTNLWNRGRTSQLDTWSRDDALWGRARADTNDQWSRGRDLWDMARIDRNDVFDQNATLADLITSRRPRPA